jgi:uncharacterized protein (DUF1697 family)
MKSVAFLKGVNVGGKSKVSMAALKAELAAKGLADVETYLNSGNILWESTLDRQELARLIHASIFEVAGIDVDVVVKSADELRASIKQNAFAGDGSKILFYYSNDPLNEELSEELKNGKGIVEPFCLHKAVLVVQYPNGVGESKFTTGYIDKKLKTKVTGRNLNTILALIGKCA